MIRGRRAGNIGFQIEDNSEVPRNQGLVTDTHRETLKNQRMNILFVRVRRDRFLQCCFSYSHGQ